MSRGGRGGGRGGRGGGHQLPIDIDPAFLEEANRFAEEQNKVEADQLKNKNGVANDQGTFVWPAYPGGVPRALLPTPYEKEMFRIRCRRLEQIRNSVMWTGDPGSLSELNRREDGDPAHYDAFNDRDTYANRLKPPPFRLPDLTKHKWAHPGVSHPPELWATMGYKPDTYEEDRKVRRLQLTRKTRDPLAGLGDDDDDGDAVERPAADDDAVEDNDEEAVEDEEPQDDDFEEDEDDNDNDYNAERYFETGEDDHDDGGDDGGGGGGDDY